MTTIFVVEKGRYSDKYIAGVFSSLDKVKEAFPNEIWREDAWGMHNIKDWEAALEVVPVELDQVD